MQNRNINQILLRGGKADIEYTAGDTIKPGCFITTVNANVVDRVTVDSSGITHTATINNYEAAKDAAGGNPAVPASGEMDAVFNLAGVDSTLPIIAAENILGGQSPNVDGVNGKAFHQPGDVVVGYMPERGALLNLRLTSGESIKRGDLLSIGAGGEVVKATSVAAAVAIADETWAYDSGTNPVDKNDKTSYGNDLIAAVIL